MEVLRGALHESRTASLFPLPGLRHRRLSRPVRGSPTDRPSRPPTGRGSRCRVLSTIDIRDAGSNMERASNRLSGQTPSHSQSQPTPAAPQNPRAPAAAKPHSRKRHVSGASRLIVTPQICPLGFRVRRGAPDFPIGGEVGGDQTANPRVGCARVRFRGDYKIGSVGGTR